MLIQPSYAVRADPARRMIHMSIRGFWDEATIADYDREVRIAALKVMEVTGCRQDELLAIVDVREASTQSQAILARFKQKFDPADRQTKRIAILVSGALLKRQVERIATPIQRVFDDEGAAMAWLLS